MFGKLLRCVTLCVLAEIAMIAAAGASVVAPLGVHREDVDETRYPWSAVGKLYNETGGSCSGVAIAVNKVLTAAHCLYNFRSQRFISAEALHFLLGYRGGRYAMHARVSSYEIGGGFDPLRYDQTSDADWAILTVTENLPADIAPLRLSAMAEPSGTKATIVGYPQDRAFAMTADSDCELRQTIDGGRLMLHTCRGVGGYSGAPILVSAGGDEVQVAGIQIAKFRSDGGDKMLAVTAQTIRRNANGGIDATPVKPAVAAIALSCPMAGDRSVLSALRLAGIGLSSPSDTTVLEQTISALVGPDRGTPVPFRSTERLALGPEAMAAILSPLFRVRLEARPAPVAFLPAAQLAQSATRP
ncbi:MAG: trypsin-like serine protease [Rhodopseudomonas sp.]|nr:trypsin-like serine protease [Rhodopseudomonas sp.]